MRYVLEAWLVIVLSVLLSGTLAAVYLQLNPRIQENQLRETLAQVPALVPGAAKGEAATVGGLGVYRALDTQGQLVGWVLRARGPGFADVIQLLIGVDAAAAKLTGLYVLEQKETPGLGNKIEAEKWRGQFAGKRADVPLAAVKGTARDQEIVAVTGATISSVAVCDIVNRQAAAFRAALASGQEGVGHGSER